MTLVAASDSPVVANLKRAGAVIIGRTNTPAFSFRLDTDNAFRGRTHNPWSRDAHAGRLERRRVVVGRRGHHADCARQRHRRARCGIPRTAPASPACAPRSVAFLRTIPTTKAERAISAQLMSVQGPLARSVRDVRLGFEAMAQRDPRDPWWVPAPLAGPGGRAGRLRVAVVDDAAKISGALRRRRRSPERCEQAANALADAGYEIVDEKTPGFARAFELWFEMLIPEFRRFMQADFERDGDDGIRTAMRFVLDNVPERDAESHLRALAERTRLVREWNLFLERTPLVLTPVWTELPYAHGFDIESAARTMRVWREAATLMAVPVLGLPAMAVPTGVADGLPVGVQIVGPRFREDLTLAAAEAIEARAPRITPIDPR